MLFAGGVIKSVMNKRGYKHRRSEDALSVHGEYARNLQFVYSCEYGVRGGVVVDLVYFAVDILNEKLVIGLYRENPKIENGVYENSSCSLPLKKISEEELGRVLDKLIPPLKNQLI